MFPNYPKRKDKRTDKDKKRVVLPAKENSVAPSTTPEFQVVDDEFLNEISINSKSKENETSFTENPVEGGKNKGGRPTAGEMEEMARELDKYYKAGIGVPLTAEITRYNIVTVRKYFKEKLQLAKMAMAETWVEEQKNQKAEALMMLDRHILQYTVIQSKIETSLKSWEDDENIRRRRVEAKNDRIRLENENLPPEEQQPLEERQPQIAYGLLKKQQEIIKSITELQLYKAQLAMQPTAGENLDEYFRQQEKKLKEMQESMVAEK